MEEWLLAARMRVKLTPGGAIHTKKRGEIEIPAIGNP